MDFYHNLITEKSWQTLGTLKKKIDFILIGGWAVYLYTKSLKSKDIDIIINYGELAKLRESFTLTKNERLHKYEARSEEVQIDVYLPYYSQLGIPVENIMKETVQRESFTLPSPEMLLILKQFTYGERSLSAKGQKDRLDILSLIVKTEIDWKHYHDLLENYEKKKFRKDLSTLLTGTFQIPELYLNQHQWSKIKKRLSVNI